MSAIERDIEAIHNGESAISAERLVFDRLDQIVEYLEFAEYKEGNKNQRIAVMETIKTALASKLLTRKLCTEKYLFLLQNIKKNAHARKVSEGVMELSYEAYAESIKSLLEFAPEQVVEIMLGAKDQCYLELILRNGESQHIIDLFPCFFSLTGATFQKWIDFLIARNFVGLIFRWIKKQKKAHRELHNFTKLLYLLVSFTGTIFSRHFPTGSEAEYTHFYRQIEQNAAFLLDIAFAEDDAINRMSALEVVREMVKISEYLPKGSSSFRFLAEYFTNSPLLPALREDHQAPSTHVKAIAFINLLARTIRYQSVEMQQFFIAADLGTWLVRYLYATTTFTVTNEVCALLNELILVNKEFYVAALLGIIKEVRAQGLAKLVGPFAASQKKGAANVSLLDHITPAIYLLYRLHRRCAQELAAQRGKAAESKVSQRRFTIIDQNSPTFQLLEELSFLQEDAWHWYRTTRIFEYEKRMSLHYLQEFPERFQNSEQFSRYICDYISSTLPEYSSFLLM